MIRRIFEWDDAFTALCDRDVFGTRTMGYYHTYGTERGEVGFYAQYLDERCVGVLSDAFGSGALTAEPQVRTHAHGCLFVPAARRAAKHSWVT